MDITDILFSYEASSYFREKLFEFAMDHNITNRYLPILVPTDTNNDVNGSQHARNGGTDFTYRDANWDDVENASALGYYEYFSETGFGYTGHYYEGSDRKFDAIVINPPAYAVEVTL